MFDEIAGLAIENTGKPVSHEDIASSMEFGTNLMLDYSPLSDAAEVEKEEREAWHYRLLFFPFTAILASVQVLIVLAYLPFTRTDGSDESEKVRNLLRRARGPSPFFGGLHWTLAEVHHGVTTARALHAIYGSPVLLRNEEGLRGRFLRLWFGFPPAAGLRNRLRWSHASIFAEMAALAARGKSEITMVSLCCGSAVAMIEAVSKFTRVFPDVRVRMTLVDLNKSALAHAAELALSRKLRVGSGPDAQVRIVEQDLMDFLKTADQRFDIVEFIGFMDYRQVDSVRSLTDSVVGMAHRGGVVFTSLIRKSRWQPVIRWIVGWIRLVYRHPGTIREITSHSRCHATVETEPSNQHVLISLRRVF